MLHFGPPYPISSFNSGTIIPSPAPDQLPSVLLGLHDAASTYLALLNADLLHLPLTLLEPHQHVKSNHPPSLVCLALDLERAGA